MAERPDPTLSDKSSVEEGLGKLSAQLTCAICKGFYNDPRVLPCLHYFCRACVSQLVLGTVALARGSGSDYVECPKCRKVHTIQNCTPDRLPAAYFVNETMESYKIMKKAKGAGVAKLSCEMCEDGKATAFCRHCAQFTCDFCAYQVHLKVKQYRGHEVVKIEDLGKGDGPIKKPAEFKRCLEHHDEVLKLYCLDCAHLVCRDCLLIVHKDHKYEFVKDGAPKSRDTLVGNLSPVKRIQGEISSAAERIEKIKTDVEQQGKDVTATIQQSFDEIIQVLEERKQGLIAEVGHKVDDKQMCLEAQLKDFGMVASTLQDVVDFVERNVQDSSDDDLMSLKKSMIDRVDEVIQKYEFYDLEPATLANLDVRTPAAEKVTEICKDTMVFETQANPSRSTVEGDGIRVAQTHQKAVFMVKALDEKGQPCKDKQDVVAKLKSLVDDTVIQASVVDNSDGVYEVSYSPLMRGRCDLKVTVNRKEIRGSPFRVMVQHHPKQLNGAVKVIESVSDPHGIVVNDNCIVVTESPPKITFFDRDIRASVTPRLSFEEIGDQKLKRPTGIAVDSDGYLYVADGEENFVAKFTQDGELVKKISGTGTHDGNFRLPGGIRVYQDRVYVCDRCNHKVHIFDTSLQHIKSFGQQGNKRGEFDWPVAAALDRSGDLYITDCNNHRIQVFSRDGKYLRDFGKKGNEAGMLQRPAFIEIDRYDFVYVTEEQNDRVSVFRSNGIYETQFGNRGTVEQGSLNFPKGIFVDEDGFIYVCDHGNRHVKIF